MNRKIRLVSGAIFALFCGFSLTNGAFGQALPEGKGKAELVRICTACHGTDLITKSRKTPAEWRKSVNDMVDRGADGSPEEIDTIVLYLSANFASDKAGSTAATQSVTTPSTLAPPPALNSTSERAKHVVSQNGCLACHRIENQGGYTGPTLNGVGARRTADEIRKAIVSPQPTLDPANALVRLTTADGKTLDGRILSQDEHDVRILDASGNVATYSKSELRQFTIVSADPMPSFEGKITGDDLDALVRYLDSLPSGNGSIRR